MSSAWIAFSGSLAGATLAGCVGLYVFWRQGRRDAEAARMQSQRGAYSRLLAATGAVVHTADILHLIAQSRSGLGDRVEVALHVRKPIEAMDLHQLLRPDTTALYGALADVSTVGSPEAVRLAVEVVDMCGEVVRIAAQPGEGRSGINETLRGQEWTEEQLEGSAAAVRRLHLARGQFVRLARAELGVELADPLAWQDQAEGAD